jgi:hypothetical protein
MDEHLLSARVASDLVRIHKERIDIYMQLLHASNDIELDVKTIVERMIEESMEYKQQLRNAIHAMAKEPGEIYKSWEDTKRSLPHADKKTILAICANDELVITNTYSLALSLVTDAAIKKLLTDQQQGLKKLYVHIQHYHDAQ